MAKRKLPRPKVIAKASAPRSRPGRGARKPRPAAIESHLWPPLGDANFSRSAALAYSLSQSQWWPAERLHKFQMKQIALLLRHAFETVPFYRDRLAGAGKPASGAALTDMFRSLPVLSREQIQNAGATLTAVRLPAGHGPTREMKTSGSSGQPVRVQRTKLANLINQAANLRNHQWFRRDLQGSNVTIKVVEGGRQRSQVRSWAGGAPSGPGIVYSNAVPAAKLFEWLLRDDPDYLQCHPSVLQELLACSRGTGKKPKRLREARSMGEILDPALRILCRDQWGVAVRDNYSCEEAGILALQCPEHEHLHVQSEKVLLEILDDDGSPTAPGATGRVVITPLQDFATPLIRYELGDRAIAGGACPCGRGLAVIERIIGRERHPVVLPSGDRVFPVLDAEPLLLEFGVRQYQLVQRQREAIEINLATDRPLTAEEESRIAAHLQKNFGYPFRFDFNYVDEIPRAAGGKFQLFRSEIS